MGSVIDISGNYYPEDIERILRRSDKDVLSSDWEAIGRDFRRVLDREAKKL
jgi:hypothetical protein